VISHDVFVVLDVMWLAGVLKPILDHRGVTKNRTGQKVREGFAVVAKEVAGGLPRTYQRNHETRSVCESSHNPELSHRVPRLGAVGCKYKLEMI